MDTTLKTLKASLEAIRDMVMNALNQIEQAQEKRLMAWKCKECQYIKHLRRLFHWKLLADVPDVKVRSLDLFYEAR